MNRVAGGHFALLEDGLFHYAAASSGQTLDICMLTMQETEDQVLGAAALRQLRATSIDLHI